MGDAVGGEDGDREVQHDDVARPSPEMTERRQEPHEDTEAGAPAHRDEEHQPGRARERQCSAVPSDPRQACRGEDEARETRISGELRQIPVAVVRDPERGSGELVPEEVREEEERQVRRRR